MEKLIKTKNMSNINYRKYTSYFLAGVIGILFVIGLRGASAATPTVPPPSGDVTPTFSGLNVNGGAKIQEALEVADISVSGDIDMAGDLQASKTIEAGGELRAKGGIVNPDGDVKINGALNVNDTMYVGPKIDGLNPTKGEWVIVDRFLATGVASFKGGTTFQNDADVKGGLTVGGSAKATGKLSTDSDLTVGGKLGVTGDSILNGAFEAKGKALFSGDTEIKNLYATGSIQNSAADGFVKIDDELDVRKGIFNNDGTSLIKFGSGSKPTKLDVTGASTLSGNVDIKGEISNSTPKSATVSGLTQPVNIKDDLKVTGNITATSEIGKYSISSKSVTVSSQGSSSTSISCASVEKMMSCDFFPTTKITDYFKNIYINKSVPTKSTTGWKCDATITNKNASGVSSQEISAYAVCFNPTTN